MDDESLPENPKKLLITLKSGVQITGMVADYTLHRDPLTGRLRDFTWTYTPVAGPKFVHVELDQIAAIQWF